MTAGVLLDRLEGLIGERVISRNTPVCVFVDEFCDLVQLKADAPLTAETVSFVNDLKKLVAYRSKVRRAGALDAYVKRKKKDIARLKRMGNVVVCVGGAQ